MHGTKAAHPMVGDLLRPVEEWRGVAYQAFADHGILRAYRRKSFIFLQGDPATAAYAVKSGRVELLSISDSGREISHSIRRPGETFGIAEVLLGRERARCMRALEDTELWVVPGEEFLDLIVTRPDVSLALLNSSLQRGIEQSKMKLVFVSTSARRRVAASLVFLARRSGAATPDESPIVVRATHEQLSRLCGMTRQTVTSELDRLEDEGTLILQSRSIVILDWDGLQRFADASA